MDLFIQLMKTPGVSEEIQQEIIYQKNKNIIKNKNNLIWELQQYHISTFETICEYMRPYSYTNWDNGDINDWKYIESIEEYNEAVDFGGFDYVEYSVMILSEIKGEEVL